MTFPGTKHQFSSRPAGSLSIKVSELSQLHVVKYILDKYVLCFVSRLEMNGYYSEPMKRAGKAGVSSFQVLKFAVTSPVTQHSGVFAGAITFANMGIAML